MKSSRQGKSGFLKPQDSDICGERDIFPGSKGKEIYSWEASASEGDTKAGRQ